MAKATVTPAPNRIIEKNIRLTGELMKYLLTKPQVFASLPDTFELIVLPEDDPEMRQYNLDLLDKFGSQGKAIVFARLKTQAGLPLSQTPLSIYTPLVA